MPEFGTRSRTNLMTCDPRLQDLFETVVESFDCTILCGHRGEEEQNKAFHEGRTTKRWPDSKHNSLPSIAVDVAPYPIDWKDTDRFYHFAGFVKGIAQDKGIKIRWGGDWDGDTDLHDQSLYDLPHFEIVE